VALDGLLMLAPRRSEHVALAGGRDVLAAGEMTRQVPTPAWSAPVSSRADGTRRRSQQYHPPAAGTPRTHAFPQRSARPSRGRRGRRHPGCSRCQRRRPPPPPVRPQHGPATPPSAGHCWYAEPTSRQHRRTPLPAPRSKDIGHQGFLPPPKIPQRPPLDGALAGMDRGLQLPTTGRRLPHGDRADRARSCRGARLAK
jgi:hypothetical protein